MEKCCVLTERLTEMSMRIIKTNGVFNFTEIEGSNGWYWCCDYASGDLYEAEELYKHNNPIKNNRLVFIHYPDGRVIEPIIAKEGQYFGAPTYDNGNLQILMVDFPMAVIRIFQHDHTKDETTLRAEIVLTEIKDCYNLMFANSPLMVIRQGFENFFQIIWPEKAEFFIGNRETFYSRDGDKLYFSRWFEDTDYREEVVIRKYPSGEIIEVNQGVLIEMPDGQRWVLQ